MNETPIPHDLPLPLPAPVPVLLAVLVVFFLMHIVFINMMIGGAFLTFWYQIKGLKDKKWDNLAHDLANSITVNKSIAVVLGVGPLLAINTLYTTYFYSANALTGDFWILVIPLVAGAFLLTYLHKFLWDSFPRWLHISIMGLVLVIFAFIPMIFLTQVTLMLQPERWPEISGFWDAALTTQVMTRYAHFVLSCPAMIGLMMVWSWKRKPDADVAHVGITRAEGIRIGYAWALWPTLGQFLIGPLAWLTLPPVTGDTTEANAVFAVSILVAALASMLMWREFNAPADRIGKLFTPVVVLMLAGIVLTVVGGHLYPRAAGDEQPPPNPQPPPPLGAASDAARAAAEAEGAAQ